MIDQPKCYSTARGCSSANRSTTQIHAHNVCVSMPKMSVYLRTLCSAYNYATVESVQTCTYQ